MPLERNSASKMTSKALLSFPEVLLKNLLPSPGAEGVRGVAKDLELLNGALQIERVTDLLLLLPFMAYPGEAVTDMLLEECVVKHITTNSRTLMAVSNLLNEINLVESSPCSAIVAGDGSIIPHVLPAVLARLTSLYAEYRPPVHHPKGRGRVISINDVGEYSITAWVDLSYHGDTSTGERDLYSVQDNDFGTRLRVFVSDDGHLVRLDNRLFIFIINIIIITITITITIIIIISIV